MTHSFLYDPEKHLYSIDGRIVPGVTGALGDVLPGWKASDWHLQRGTAVHACAALVAQGKAFECDERIQGQVNAVKKWFGDVQPVVHGVEIKVWNTDYLYGGTLDLLCSINGKEVVVDFKATLTDAVPIQCAAYALALPSPQPKLGLGVELREDGTYKMSKMYDLKRYKMEWMALLAAHNIRKRFKLVKPEEEGA